jgi:hypothetical protein
MYDFEAKSKERKIAVSRRMNALSDGNNTNNCHLIKPATLVRRQELEPISPHGLLFHNLIVEGLPTTR